MPDSAPENSLFVEVTTGRQHTIPIYKEWPAGGYLEIGSSHFSLNSAVFLPNDSEKNQPDESEDIYSSGIVMLERTIHFLELTQKTLLIAGHSDTLGDPGKNTTLSNYRAQAVYSVLAGERDLFVTVANAPHIPDKNQKEQTLVHDKLLIADWAAREFDWPCTLQENKYDHVRTYKAFQRSYNNHLKQLNPGVEELAVDGDWGPKTWGAVFDCYQFKLAQRLTIARKDLDSYRSKLNLGSRFTFAKKPYVACGEYHPIDRPGQNETASKINRRVEMIFFDTGVKPELSCVNGECNGKRCTLYLQLQSVRGKIISARWEYPLVLAGHVGRRKMIVHHGGAKPGDNVSFTVVQACEGEVKKFSSSVTSAVSAGYAMAEFEELSDETMSQLKGKEGEVFYSYFFIAKGEDWMTVSARLHSANDGAIYE